MSSWVCEWEDEWTGGCVRVCGGCAGGGTVVDAAAGGRSGKYCVQGGVGKTNVGLHALVGPLTADPFPPSLADRSRVVSIKSPERSYHIFYQLCAGASPDQRAALRWALETHSVSVVAVARLFQGASASREWAL